MDYKLIWTYEAINNLEDILEKANKQLYFIKLRVKQFTWFTFLSIPEILQE